MTTQPRIIVSNQDADRLEALLDSLSDKDFPGKDVLLDELDRAENVDSKDIPPTVVTMNSTVRFKVASSGESFCKTLVYPKDMDNSGDKVSILAPIGSAVLGLAEGDEIQWPAPGGKALTVHIDEVIYQPERAGEFHR
ncbi:nucleoside diphosphate kinase regulator [Bowmanella pacifica]|uniref:Nucleoside diphosphate kinase regulator n=1 Tax=Bowmanella pacifica TaxID=502051 RepID=A0A918DL66_9ALTE|nr:nucleoside diphosphate kinase regulator [Bowmanella pacifica]GGO70164.1 nucleoside diphosphate kinase regulator [Bowmanella pacifica]